MKQHPPEFWRQRVDLNMNVFDLLLLHGYTSLALKHPLVGEQTVQFGADLLQRLEDLLLALGALEPSDIKIARAERGIGSH